MGTAIFTAPEQLWKAILHLVKSQMYTSYEKLLSLHTSYMPWKTLWACVLKKHVQDDLCNIMYNSPKLEAVQIHSQKASRSESHIMWVSTSGKKGITATCPGTNITWWNTKSNAYIKISFPFMILPCILKIKSGLDLCPKSRLMLFRPRSNSTHNCTHRILESTRQKVLVPNTHPTDTRWLNE